MLFCRTFLRCDFLLDLLVHDLHPFIEIANRQLKEVADWRLAVFGETKRTKPELAYPHRLRSPCSFVLVDFDDGLALYIPLPIYLLPTYFSAVSP